MVSSSQSVIVPIIYSDIFNFPLHIDELWYYMGQTTYKKEDVLATVIQHPQLSFQENYICLKGKEVYIKKRIKNIPKVEMQYKKAKRVAFFLGLIPWVLCITLSGSLAAGQYKKNDDIDLFIITKPNTLWLSRFLLLGVVALLRKRRKKTQLHAPGSICINFLIDTEKLDMSIFGRDMYIAWEVAQLKVLVNKHHTFELFLKRNTWIKNYVGYTVPSRNMSYPKEVTFLTRYLSRLAENIQRKSIEKSRTKELVERHIAAFHPSEYHTAILAQLEARMSTIPH